MHSSPRLRQKDFRVCVAHFFSTVRNRCSVAFWSEKVHLDVLSRVHSSRADRYIVLVVSRSSYALRCVSGTLNFRKGEKSLCLESKVIKFAATRVFLSCALLSVCCRATKRKIDASQMLSIIREIPSAIRLAATLRKSNA